MTKPALRTGMVAAILLTAANVASAASMDYALAVVQAQSHVTVAVTAMGYTGSDSSPVIGDVYATLDPAVGPFVQIHITAFSVDLVETLQMTLGPGGYFGGVQLTGTGLGIRMGDDFGLVGPPAPVDALGAFVQAGNEVHAIGIIHYHGFGLLGSPIGDGDRDLAVEPAVATDLAGTVTDSDSTVTLVLPVDIQNTLNIQGYSITVHITGTLVAVAPTVVPGCSGDCDCDGDRDFDDIKFLVAALGGEAAWTQYHVARLGTPPTCDYIASCDTNGDDAVDFDDIKPFVALIGVPCP